MTLKAGKVWGTNYEVFDNQNVEVRVIRFKRGFSCSWHRHQFKTNMFHVISGKMVVETRKNDYDLTDRTYLGIDDTHVVAAGEEHRFIGVQDGVALEIYEVQIDGRDIVRSECGGQIHDMTLKSLEEGFPK